MATTYEKAPKDVRDLCEIVMRKHHEPLVTAKVRVDLLMAFGERDDASEVLIAPALKHGGYQATGIARIVSYKDRVKGLGDAEILIDGDWWEKANEAERKALLDHELQHFAKTDKVDDLGRPKLKMRRHDVQIGWFKCVAERNGVNSQERIQAAQVMHEYQQVFWPTDLKVSESRMANLELHQKTPPKA